MHNSNILFYQMSFVTLPIVVVFFPASPTKQTKKRNMGDPIISLGTSKIASGIYLYVSFNVLHLGCDHLGTTGAYNDQIPHGSKNPKNIAPKM